VFRRHGLHLLPSDLPAEHHQYSVYADYSNKSEYACQARYLCYLWMVPFSVFDMDPAFCRAGFSPYALPSLNTRPK
jgi:hypothetical protein